MSEIVKYVIKQGCIYFTLYGIAICIGGKINSDLRKIRREQASDYVNKIRDEYHL